MTFRPAWVVDRQYFWLTAAMGACLVPFAVLPSDFNFGFGGPLAALLEVMGQLRWPLTFMAGLYLILRRWRLAVPAAGFLNHMLLALLLWFLLSALWSRFPGMTLRESLRMIALALAGFGFSLASWQPARFWQLARGGLTAVAAASLLVVLLAPHIGVHAQETDPGINGNWRGVTTHKNSLGAVCALCMMLWTHAWASSERRLRQCLPWMVLVCVVLVGTRSSTSLVTAMLCCGLIVALERSPVKLRGWRLATSLVVAMIVAAPVFAYLIIQGSVSPVDVVEPITSAIGKDVTFTGRTALWAVLVEEIPRHPWIGVGHAAFWGDAMGPSHYLARAIGWLPGQGHSFYLDLINEAGFVGLVLFLGFVGVYLRDLMRLASVRPSQARLNGVVLLYVLITGFTESDILRAITLQTALLMFAVPDVGRALFDVRLRASAPAAAAGTATLPA